MASKQRYASRLVNDCEGCLNHPLDRDKVTNEPLDERCYTCRRTPSCGHGWDRVVVSNSFRTAYQPRVSSVCEYGEERILCQHPYADIECADFWGARAIVPVITS